FYCGEFVGQVQEGAHGGVFLVSGEGLGTPVGGLDLRPAGLLGGGQGAAEFGELEQVGLRVRGERLRLGPVVVVYGLLQFGGVHHREDALGELVHVAVGPLQAERGFGAGGVVLRRGGDVGAVDGEDD